MSTSVLSRPLPVRYHGPVSIPAVYGVSRAGTILLAGQTRSACAALPEYRRDVESTVRRSHRQRIRRCYLSGAFRHRTSDPDEIMRHPLRCPSGSDVYHFARLNRSFGGWYPTLGQLERCASEYFELIEEVDGTEDYRRTAEEWLQRSRKVLASWHGVKIWLESLPTWLRHPIQYPTMLWCMLGSGSWNWQFRPPAPTRLLRRTWRYRG